MYLIKEDNQQDKVIECTNTLPLIVKKSVETNDTTYTSAMIVTLLLSGLGII